MRYSLPTLVFLVISLFLVCIPARAGSLAFTYSLPTASTTSAGAYKTDGTLLRTLWSNESRPAGTNSGTWDGKDDAGQAVPAGSYQIKVLYHNVTYTWQGTIANTSTNQTGTTVHRGFSGIQGMAFSGTKGFIANGYCEQQPTWRGIDTSDPNAVTSWGPIDQTRQFQHVATDGTNVYYANVGNGWISSWPTFVAAFKVSDNSPVTFTNGVVAPAAGGGSMAWNSVLDLQSGQTNAPTGIAVQPSGQYLFVSHSGMNAINVFNKTTGAFVRTLTYTAPGALACTPNGDLWMTYTPTAGNRSVVRSTVSATGTLTTVEVLSGQTSAIALAVSPDNSTLLIAEADPYCQVMAINNTVTGTAPILWRLGQSGGYNAANGPNVANDKFSFIYGWDDSSPVTGTFLAFQPDGSFWVGDPGNERYLHFSAARAYLGQIAFLSHNYVSTVCVGDTTRVFAKGWLEYAVDYSQPTANGSWSLVKNWTAGLPANLAHVHYGGFNAVVKMSNGRTYATAYNSATSQRAILELPSSGMARQTGIEIPSNQTLHEDSSLRWQTIAGPAVTYNQRALTGFDASFNPQWGTATVMASTTRQAADPVTGGGIIGPEGPRYPVTSGNVMVTSNGQGYGAYVYHLGGIAAGGTNWLWKAAPPARYFDGHGSIGAFCTYPSNTHFVQGHNILLGCHGEFYTPPNGSTGEANQYLHYWDNGLMVGEFGNPYCGIPYSTGVVAGTAGNSFSPYLVQVGSDMYLWHNDESHASGLHRWKISNSNSINVLAVNVTVPATGGNGTGLTGQYFSGVNFDTAQLTRTDPTVDFTWSGSPGSSVPADSFSVRWTGLVQPLYSEAYTFYTQSDNGVRMWLDGQLIIDNWTSHASTENASAPISLTAGTMHSVILQTYDDTGTAVAQLKWSSASQAKGIIPMPQLYPSDYRAINCGGPATGRFQADPLGITGGNIISTAASIDTSAVFDPAPMSVYQKQRQRYAPYNFSGLAPLTNYKVRLHLAEIQSPMFSVGSRVFKVKVNNLDNIVPDIDIFAAAGAGNKAVVREFTATSDNTGNILLTVNESPNFDLIAGIELLRDVSDAATSPAFAITGLGTGLKGQYYNDTTLTTLIQTRTDPEINFNWANTGPMASVGPHNYTVRWTGKVQSIEPGNYTFQLNATNGGRLWVNNQLLIDSWTVSGAHSGTITLNASTKYDIKVEYIDNAGSSVVALNWTRPGMSPALIPRSQFYPAP